MTALGVWFSSGQPAIIAGHLVRVRRHPLLNVPLEMSCGQASTYWLTADNNTQWILKQFLPARRPQPAYVAMVASCVPQAPAFRCCWQRRVLTAQDLTASEDGFWSEELGMWLDGAILMPRLSGRSWGELLFDLCDGRTSMSQAERLVIARQLAEAIMLLELADASHRDLSAGNILIEPGNGELHLIDWDSLFHPALQFQPNTTEGTSGYIAPWAISNAQNSWCPHADRFALAVCMAEILTVAPGSSLHGDGSLFEQASLGRDSRKLDTLTSALQAVYPDAVDLFRNAWRAATFDECPSPADWLQILPELVSTGTNAILGRLPTTESLDHRTTMLMQLRRALREQRDDAVEPALLDDPDLERLLNGAERADLDRVRERLSTLRSLRTALERGDDEVIARLAKSPDLRVERLRSSEQLEIEWATERVQALEELEVAVQRGDDAAAKEAWWRAALLDCRIPPALDDAARVARWRQADVPTQSPPPPAPQPIKLSLSSPTELATQYVAARHTAQDAAADALRQAITSGDKEAIADAARIARREGTSVPDVPWDIIYEAEEQVTGLAELRDALQRGDPLQSALTWAKATSLWPQTINPADDMAGKAAFQFWGHTLWQKVTGRTTTADDP
jgi:serine/threonine protein kinase